MENESNESEKLVKFLCEVGKLKHLDRTGWTLAGRDIDRPETVAGHMYRMGVMAMLYTPDEGQTVNKDKLVRLALIHDMAECIVGDITPFDGISSEKKRELEVNAMQYLGDKLTLIIIKRAWHSSWSKLFEKIELILIYELLGTLLPEKNSQEFKCLFDEYESQETTEAKIIKEFDLFDVMLQAFQYEQREHQASGRVIRFQDFFDNAKGRIRSQQLVRMAVEIDRIRAEFWSQIESKPNDN